MVSRLNHRAAFVYLSIFHNPANNQGEKQQGQLEKVKAPTQRWIDLKTAGQLSPLIESEVRGAIHVNLE